VAKRVPVGKYSNHVKKKLTKKEGIDLMETTYQMIVRPILEEHGKIFAITNKRTLVQFKQGRVA